MSKDSYEPDSGGLLDEYVGTIDDAWFATDSRYNNGETLLMFWRMTTDNPDVPELEERFSCGGGWESLDGGKTAENQSGKTRFHPSSLYGKIIQRCVNDFKIRDELEERGESYEASIWPGLRFEMARERVEYGGDIGGRDRILPQAFVGVVGEGGSSAGASQSGTTTAAPLPSVFDDLEPEMKDALRKARGEATTHIQFVDRCMDLPGVVGNDMLVRAIATEDGLWKELA